MSSIHSSFSHTSPPGKWLPGRCSPPLSEVAVRWSATISPSEMVDTTLPRDPIHAVIVQCLRSIDFLWRSQWGFQGPEPNTTDVALHLMTQNRIGVSIGPRK